MVPIMWKFPNHGFVWEGINHHQLSPKKFGTTKAHVMPSVTFSSSTKPTTRSGTLAAKRCSSTVSPQDGAAAARRFKTSWGWTWNHSLKITNWYIYWLVVLTCFNHLEKYESQSTGRIIPYIMEGGLLVGSPHLSPDSNPWAPSFLQRLQVTSSLLQLNLGVKFTSQKAALQDLRCLLDDYRHWYYMMYYDVWGYYIMILYDIWYMLYAIWYMIYAIWYMIWYMVYDICHYVWLCMHCVCIVYALCMHCVRLCMILYDINAVSIHQLTSINKHYGMWWSLLFH